MICQRLEVFVRLGKSKGLLACGRAFFHGWLDTERLEQFRKLGIAHQVFFDHSGTLQQLVLVVTSFCEMLFQKAQI